jgi:hypothetical protein
MTLDFCFHNQISLFFDLIALDASPGVLDEGPEFIIWQRGELLPFA